MHPSGPSRDFRILPLISVGRFTTPRRVCCPNGEAVARDRCCGKEGPRRYFITPSNMAVVPGCRSLFHYSSLIGTMPNGAICALSRCRRHMVRTSMSTRNFLRGYHVFTSKNSQDMIASSGNGMCMTGKSVSVFSPSNRSVNALRIPRHPASLLVSKGGLCVATLSSLCRVRLWR